MYKFVSIAIIGACLTLPLNPTTKTVAQENGAFGRMWTFENPPLSYLEEEYDFKPDQKWLQSLRLGSLRLGGEDILSGFGSASFVSPQGLILTSTRCIPEAISWPRPRKLAMIEKTGFVAKAPEQEVRLKTRGTGWLTAAQLVKTTKITEKVNDGVLSSDDDIRIKTKRDLNKKAILAAAKKSDPKLVSQIVSLHSGAVFQLYQYKVYTDVRLVCMPHLQTAHFGRDKENFAYPRHCLDFAFLRAYEDGKPAHTSKHYFEWKTGGPTKGELVFVSGNPGPTKRLLTEAQLSFEREITLPMHQELLTSRLRIRKDSDEYHGNFSLRRPIGLVNGLKATSIRLKGLENAKLVAKKVKAEEAFKRRVMADKNLAERYSDLWNRIEQTVAKRRLHEAKLRFYTSGSVPPLNSAITIVRSFDPSETTERREEAKKQLEDWGDGPVLPNYAYRISIVDQFERARNWLPKNDDFFLKVLRGNSGEEFLEAVIGPRNAGHRGGPKLRSLVYYPEKVNAVIKSGWEGIKESEDPAIVAARELVVLMRNNETITKELIAKEEALGAEMGRAFLACYGTTASPDGTMTPRFTVGVVKDFSMSGTFVPFPHDVQRALCSQR